MVEGKVEGSRLQTQGIILVGVLWLLQSVGRLSFAFVGTPEGMGKFLDVPISPTTSQILFVMFLFLGVCGIIAAFGVLAKQKWGFWAIIMVSIATVAFDIWGITLQYTAALGLIVPVISIFYLYLKKS
ncbi:MAG: hypothetical protein QHH18_05695 [Candidatus Bathyarchaeota archaeon]|jgi:hypothetical protein|nr:hypothetical protein [Candidatus Bathyarchaeota archaeon A05DMB-5]MDH7558082.1 hypothetical protein [Candidatus Bathyarchaeota archaeon]